MANYSRWIMKSQFTILLVWLCAYTACAQKEANIWYFGSRAGFDFNKNCQPTALSDSPIDANFGVAVMSDGKTGQLLVYTNGHQVFNRDHRVMPAGTYEDYAGSGPFPQRALFIPVPDQPSAYYFFRMAEVLSNGNPTTIVNLRYSRIEMTLDGGLGDVVRNGRDADLAGGLACRLTAIRHTNGRDYWLLTHQWNSDAFLVYPVTSKGVGKADTLHIGSTYTDQEPWGFIKASPDGQKLACSVLNITARPFDLFDFDASTGKLSNYLSLGNIRIQYGVSFSPDNTKLYVSNRVVAEPGQNNSREVIRQYNLKAGTTAAIVASGKSIIYQNPNRALTESIENNRTGFYSPALQIAPDGRIYAAADYSNEISGDPCQSCRRHFLVINKPNEAGFTCDVQLQTAELGSGAVGDVSDWPNFMQHYFNGLVPRNCAFDSNDDCTAVNIQLFPSPATNVLEILVTDLCFTPYTLRIVNMTGQILAEYDVKMPRSQQVDVSQLADGMYVAELHFTDRTITKRFLKH